MKKIYKSDKYNEAVICVAFGSYKTFRVEFSGGNVRMNQPSRLITNNPCIQIALENDPRYNIDYCLESEIKEESDYEKERLENAMKAAEEAKKLKVKAFEEVATLDKAKEVLAAQPYNVKVDKINTIAKAKEVADKKGVSFPNLK